MPEEVQAMAPGGVWLSEGGGTGTPHYVVNPDHIARLQSQGYQPIADPRISADGPEPEKEQSEQGSEPEKEPEKEEEAKHDDTNGRLAAVRANATNKRGAGRVDAAR